MALSTFLRDPIADLQRTMEREGGAAGLRRLEEELGREPVLPRIALGIVGVGLLLLVTLTIIAGVAYADNVGAGVDSARSAFTFRPWFRIALLAGTGVILVGIITMLLAITVRIWWVTFANRTFVYPPFPLTARLFPMLMLFGLIIFLSQFGVSAWLATEAKAGDMQTVTTHADWVQGLRFVGVGVMLTGIALALFTITGLMRFLAARVQQIAAEAIEADA